MSLTSALAWPLACPLGVSTVFRNSSFDPDAVAFAIKVLGVGGNAIAPSNLTKVSDLFKAIKGNVSSWNNVRIQLYGGDYNANTGSVLVTAGGMSTDNHNLIGSPTWAAKYMQFNGTSQYGKDPNNLWTGGTAVSVLVDFNVDAVGGINSSIFTVYNSTTDRSYRIYITATGNFVLNTSLLGTTADTLVKSYGMAVAATDYHWGQSYGSSTEIGVFNGVAVPGSGSVTSGLFASAGPVVVAATGATSQSSFFGGKLRSIIWIKETLTATQMNTIRVAQTALQ